MQQAHLGKSIKNDMWITKEEDDTPDILPELPGFHVLVRPVSVKEKTKGGILIPNSTKEDMSYLTTVGVKMILLYDDQVIMKVEDPKYLDPTFNLSH
jgi:hypothetical protein